MNRCVDFLVTKHGLAAATKSDDVGFYTLYAYFLAAVDRSMAPPPAGGSNATPDTADDVAERILDAITNGPAEQYMSTEMEQRLALPSARE